MTAYIYLARAASGPHKIGWSRCPSERIKGLMSETSQAVVLVHQVQTEHATCIEAHLHRCFEGKRISGEWFDLEDEDVAYIRSLTPETISALHKQVDRDAGKTEQVRLPVELMKDVRSVASVLGESANDYIARVVREALRRDMPRAAKMLTKRADQASHEPRPEDPE